MKMRIVGIICIVLILSLVVSCNIKTGYSPWWEIMIVAPLVNQYYPIVDLERDENIFSCEEGGYMYFFSAEEVSEGVIEPTRLRITPGLDPPVPFPLTEYTGYGYIPICDEIDEDDARIYEAIVHSGEFVFRFRDVCDNVDYLVVTFREVYMVVDGDFINKVVEIHRDSLGVFPDVHVSDLEGYTLKNRSNPDILLYRLNFTVNNYPVVISEPTNGMMTVKFEQTINFVYIDGYLDNFMIERLNTDPVEITIDIDWPINIEHAMTINRPEMVIMLESFLGFDSNFSAVIISTNYRSNKEEIYYLNKIIPAVVNVFEGGISEVRVPEEQAARLMSIAPDNIIVRDVTAMIEQPEVLVRGTAKSGRAFEGEASTKIIFDFDFNSSVPVWPATLDYLSISTNNREHFERRVGYARFIVKLYNYYSVGGVIQLHFSNSDDHNIVFRDDNLFSPALDRLVISRSDSGKPLIIEAGTLEQPSEIEYAITIPKEHLPIFYRIRPGDDSDKIFHGFKIWFYEDKENNVIHPDETIRVVSRLEARVRVDFD